MSKNPNSTTKFNEEAEKRRAALRAIKNHFKLTDNSWCKLAGIGSSSVLANFLRGDSASLSIRTYNRLAKPLGLSVAQLMGEEPIIKNTGLNPHILKKSLEHVFVVADTFKRANTPLTDDQVVNLVVVTYEENLEKAQKQ